MKRSGPIDRDREEAYPGASHLEDPRKVVAIRMPPCNFRPVMIVLAGALCGVAVLGVAVAAPPSGASGRIQAKARVLPPPAPQPSHARGSDGSGASEPERVAAGDVRPPAGVEIQSGGLLYRVWRPEPDGPGTSPSVVVEYVGN